jgi:copper transport protein
VIVRLFDETEEEMAPIAVPIEPFEDKQMGEESYGMRKHSYRVSGDYLAYPGRWRLEVRVMDSEDNETVYTKPMMIY